MVFTFFLLRQTDLRLVKRRQALVETNLSRNSQLETHRCDGLGGRVKPAPHFLSRAGLGVAIGIDRFPHAWKNSRWRLAKQFGFELTPISAQIGVRNHILHFSALLS